MPDNPSATPLSIQKTYTLLESIYIPNGLYNPKYQYASLAKTKLCLENTKQFLADIKHQLESTSKNLTALLNKATIKALFNLEDYGALNTIMVHLREEQKQLITPDLICTQLAEFIDLSRLTHFIAKTPKGLLAALQHLPLLLQNSSLLEKFAALTQLKFKLFEANLIHLLETSQEQSPILEEIVATLIMNYLPQVAVARYPLGISLSEYDTSADKLKTIIEDKKIPALESAFAKYKDNVEVYYDAEEPEEDFYDAEDNLVVTSETSPSSSADADSLENKKLAQTPKDITPVCTGEAMQTTKNKNSIASSNKNKHKKYSLTHFWNWLKNILENILKTEKHKATTFHSTMNKASHSQASTPNVMPSYSHRNTTTNRASSNGTIPTASKNKASKEANLSSSEYSFFTNTPTTHQRSLQEVLMRSYMRFM